MPPQPRPTSPRPAASASASASNSRDSPTSDSSVSLSTTPRQSYLDPHGRSQQLPSSSSSMTSRPASMSTSAREANLGRGLPSQVSQVCHTRRQRIHTVCRQTSRPCLPCMQPLTRISCTTRPLIISPLPQRYPPRRRTAQAQGTVNPTPLARRRNVITVNMIAMLSLCPDSPLPTWPFGTTRTMTRTTIMTTVWAAAAINTIPTIATERRDPHLCKEDPSFCHCSDPLLALALVSVVLP